MQQKLALSRSSCVRMQQLVWKRHRFVMVSPIVQSGKLALGERMRSVLMMAVERNPKRLNRETQVQARLPPLGAPSIITN
jgi:hypothetical protein